MFAVQFLPNPRYREGLRPLTGIDSAVASTTTRHWNRRPTATASGESKPPARAPRSIQPVRCVRASGAQQPSKRRREEIASRADSSRSVPRSLRFPARDPAVTRPRSRVRAQVAR